jgi:hypothetical protein
VSDALPAIDPLAFYGVAIALSVLLAVAEVGAAYKDTSHSSFRTILSLWALPLYLLYALLTVLLGLVLIENQVLKPSWTGAILLGLAGPAIFRTRIRLFQNISGKEGPSANLERLVAGMQSFCFTQINRRLSRRRVLHKERVLMKVSEKALRARLRTVYPAEKLARIEALVDERREIGPESVRALMIALIEEQDPYALDHPFETRGAEGEHD